MNAGRALGDACKTGALVTMLRDHLQQIEAWCKYPGEHLTDGNAPRCALEQIKHHAAESLSAINALAPSDGPI